MGRRDAKVDANQPEIVAFFRDKGCTVQHLHMVGEGCPDLLVGYRGQNLLVEVKDGDKPDSAQKLTKQQVKWHADWEGDLHVVNSCESAAWVLTEVDMELADVYDAFYGGTD